MRITMSRIYIIIIAILCCTTTPVAIADDIIKHYDEHHNITGYTVIDGDRKSMGRSSVRKFISSGRKPTGTAIEK